MVGTRVSVPFGIHDGDSSVSLSSKVENLLCCLIGLSDPFGCLSVTFTDFSFPRCLGSGDLPERGWSGGAMVLGKLPVPGRPTIWITVGQGPTALAVGAGGGCLDIFTLIYPFFPRSPSLWDGPI